MNKILSGMLLTAIIIFFVYKIFGNFLGSDTSQESDEVVLERTRPVGQVNIAKMENDSQTGESQEKQPPVSVIAEVAGQEAQKDSKVTQGPAPASGEDVAKANCLACHATGLMDSPRVGDKPAWDARYANGFDTLVEHATTGFKSMPPRGGNPGLSDTEISLAILYMLGESGLDVPEKNTIVVSTVEESATVTPDPDSAPVQESVPGPADQVVADTDKTGAISVGQVTEPQPETEQESNKAGMSIQITSADPDDPQAIEKARTMQKAGEPVYIEHCAICHDSGTDNAPVAGQQSDWLTSFSKGTENLSVKTIKGPPSHPGLDENNITEAQVTDAINYILQLTFWPDNL